MMQHDLDQVLKQHPTLTAFGFDMKENRQAKLSEFEASIEWLSQFDKTKTIRRHSSSYGLKHVMEWASGTYVANGAFIAAAICLGFAFEQHGPNAYFNISKRATGWRGAASPNAYYSIPKRAARVAKASIAE